MFHRPHAALRVPRSADSRKHLEIFIWMLIGLVVYVMIRFVLADIVQFARMPAAAMNVSPTVNSSVVAVESLPSP